MTLKDLILAAIKEDMPSGDITTASLALSPRMGRAELIAKQELVLSGTASFEETMLMLEPNVKLLWHYKEGDLIKPKATVCTITGDLIQVLKAERVALNFIGHLSGVATLTRLFVEKVKGTKTKILDTRKTLPGYRDLEKRAVVHGGGENHRLNLSDAVLIKDNHIRVSGGIAQALQRIQAHTRLPIEIEARTLEEVREAIVFKPQRILLDNMDNETLAKAVVLVPPGMQTEASGNMTLDRVAGVAGTGVNYISVGALTHSAPNADYSLMFDWQSSALSAKSDPYERT